MHSPTIIINRVLGQCNPSHYFVLTFFPYLVEIDVLKLYNTLKIYLPREAVKNLVSMNFRLS